MAEGVGIEPTTDSFICPQLVLKTSGDTSPRPFLPAHERPSARRR